MVQEFGGAWTQEKLRVLTEYAKLYTDTLKRSGWFRLHCIDAFAGTGFVESSQGRIKGAALRLAQLPFDNFYFVEIDGRKSKALESWLEESVLAKSHFPVGDANLRVPEILKSLNERKDRVLLFLDPFGMQVHWDTLREISKIPICDVIYLFPSSSILRAMPHASEGHLLSSMKDKVCNCLGMTEEEIESQFYRESPQQSMLEKVVIERDANADKVDRLVIDRLGEIFAYVHPRTKQLRGPKKAVLFSLVLCASNDSPKAKSLISKFAGHSFK